MTSENMFVLFLVVASISMCSVTTISNITYEICSSEILENSCRTFGRLDYDFNPLKLGIEVLGVDLEDKLKHHPDFFKSLKNEVHRHGVIVFRNQSHLSSSSFLQMAEEFGELFDNPYIEWMDQYRNHSKSPCSKITRLSNDEKEGFTMGGKKGWHIDGAFAEKPHAFIIFHAVHAASQGDTRFARFSNVLKSLSLEKLQQFYTNHTSLVHGKSVTVIHPLLYNHPRTGEKVLCIHLGYMDNMFERRGENEVRILSPEEVVDLKQEITQAIVAEDDKFVYSHKWETGDIVIFDNLALTHEATKESKLPVSEIGLRVLHHIKVLSTTRPVQF